MSEIDHYMQAVSRLRTEIARLESELKEARAEIPETFYADLPLRDRVKQLVRIWQNAVRANQDLEKEKLLWDEWDAQDRQKTREINILTKENRELAAQQKMLEELVRAWMDLRLVGNIRVWRERYGTALGEDFERMYISHSFDRPIERLIELTEARGIHSLIPKE